MINRILSLIEEAGMTDSALCQKLSLGNGSVGKWRSGRQRPSLDAIIKISQYFNVSIDYLVFGTYSPTEKESRDNTINNKLSENDIFLLKTYHRLPVEKQHEFLGELIGYQKALDDMQKK